MYLTLHVFKMSSECASSSLPKYKKGRTLVGGQLMDPEAHGVDIDSKGHEDLIFESHSFGNLYVNSEKPPTKKSKKSFKTSHLIKILT